MLKQTIAISVLPNGTCNYKFVKDTDLQKHIVRSLLWQPDNLLFINGVCKNPSICDKTNFDKFCAIEQKLRCTVLHTV